MFLLRRVCTLVCFLLQAVASATPLENPQSVRRSLVLIFLLLWAGAVLAPCAHAQQQTLTGWFTSSATASLLTEDSGEQHELLLDVEFMRALDGLDDVLTRKQVTVVGEWEPDGATTIGQFRVHAIVSTASPDASYALSTTRQTLNVTLPSVNAVELESLACSLEDSLVSASSEQATTIFFENRTREVRSIYWLNFAGERVWFATLNPDASYTQQTYTEHVWIITDTDTRCLSIHKALATPGTVTLQADDSSSTPGTGICTIGYSGCATESYHTIAEANPWLTNEPGTGWCHLWGAGSTQAEADSSALGACQAAGCTTCQITRRWSGSTCLARADNATTGFYGWAADPSLVTAERKALEVCEQSGGDDTPSGEGAALENPAPGSFQSGLGVISGWACDASQIEIEFNNDAANRWQAGYGTQRTDTQGVCGDTDNGFGLPFNWNKLGDGVHTVTAYADGVEFAHSTVIVTTLGSEFRADISGEFPISDFPTVGTDSVLRWQKSQQNFVITDGSTGSGGGTSGSPPRVLENPQSGSFQSGLGIISGWVCEASQIEIEFNNDAANRWPAGYGTRRTDTQGECGDTDNGFGLLFNWNKLGDGIHTVRVYADGSEFAQTTVTVTTLGQEFRTGLSQEMALLDFPEVGTDAILVWQEAQQNFVIAAAEPTQRLVDVRPTLTLPAGVSLPNVTVTSMLSETAAVRASPAPTLLLAEDDGDIVLLGLADMNGGLLGEAPGEVEVSVNSTAVVLATLVAGTPVWHLTPAMVAAITSHSQYTALTTALTTAVAADPYFLDRLDDFPDLLRLLREVAAALPPPASSQAMSMATSVSGSALHALALSSAATAPCPPGRTISEAIKQTGVDFAQNLLNFFNPIDGFRKIAAASRNHAWASIRYSNCVTKAETEWQRQNPGRLHPLDFPPDPNAPPPITGGPPPRLVIPSQAVQGYGEWEALVAPCRRLAPGLDIYARGLEGIQDVLENFSSGGKWAKAGGVLLKKGWTGMLKLLAAEAIISAAQGAQQAAAEQLARCLTSGGSRQECGQQNDNSCLYPPPRTVAECFALPPGPKDIAPSQRQGRGVRSYDEPCEPACGQYRNSHTNWRGCRWDWYELPDGGGMAPHFGGGGGSCHPVSGPLARRLREYLETLSEETDIWGQVPVCP